ncbi:MAG: O-antigen polymerase [Planctomycetales bacterium]
MLILCTILLGGMIGGGLLWVSLRYQTFFHPLLMPLASLFVMGVFAPLAQLYFFGERKTESFQVQASLLSSLYVIGLCLPFVTRLNPCEQLVTWLLAPLERSALPAEGRRSRWFAVGLLVCWIALYLLLICDSPLGWDWLLHSRTAYQFGRAGVGHWFVLSQAALFLGYLAWLCDRQVKSIWKIVLATLICTGGFVLFGSKNGVVGALISGGLYYHYFVRPIPQRWLVMAGCAALPLVIISPWLQGSFNSLKQTMRYYDYFDNTAMYLEHQEVIGRKWGGAMLSSFWEYVPRGFYPAKPFIHGQLSINEYFWPGLTALGHTPAFLPWIVYYLDLGTLGVFLGGLVTGLIYKGVYVHFLHRRSFLSFVVLLQVCFVPVLKFSPALYFAMFLIAVAWSHERVNVVCHKLMEKLHPKVEAEPTAPMRRGTAAAR